MNENVYEHRFVGPRDYRMGLIVAVRFLRLLPMYPLVEESAIFLYNNYHVYTYT